MGGGVKCWGYGLNGRLGHGDTSDAHYPVDVVERAGSSSPLTGIVSVSGGREQTCALTHRGEILCWGKDVDGSLGNNTDGDQLTPVKVVSDASGTPLHTGGVWRRQYTCLRDGTCEAEPGSLVRPLLTGSRSDTSPTPEVKVLGLEEDESVTLHTEGSCSTDSIGSGTVATGETSVTITPDTDLVARENRIYVKVGEACSLSGVDYTFENGSDRIGGKSSSDEHAPTLTANFLADGDAISLHSSPDCSDAAVVSGTAGGTSEALSLPTELENHGLHIFYLKQNDICHPRGFEYYLELKKLAFPPLAQISATETHTCVVTSKGGVACWGFNGAGQLGDDSRKRNVTQKSLPTQVVDSGGNALTGVVQVGVGTDYSGGSEGRSCALTEEGKVFCWGKGYGGALGNDCNNSCPNMGHAVAVVAADGSADPLSGIVQIGVGANHTCALMTEGSVVCWGQDYEGQLGNQDTANKDHPVSVVTSEGDPLTGIVQLAAGERYTCALTVGGEVLCWGDNTYGQLGDKSTQNKNAPVNVVTADSTPLSGIVQISGGFYHACALTNGGEVQCWGHNTSGQLGDGSTDSKNYAVAVVEEDGTSPTARVVHVSSGQYHTCALTDRDGVQCWGSSYHGQLGDDTTTDKVYPVAVVMKKDSPLPLSGIVELTVGGSHGCALVMEGEVRCWGYGTYGNLGNNATNHKSAPVVVLANSSGDHFHLGLWQRQSTLVMKMVSAR